MNVGPIAKFRVIFIQTRVSAVSRAGSLWTAGLAAIALIASIATQFRLASLPNIMPLVFGVVALDVLSRFVPHNRTAETLQTILYGLLYLVVTILCGVLAAYAMQRLAFPLQDRLLARADAALGLHWLGYAHWVDGHEQLQKVLRFAYDTLQLQIAFPLVILACGNRIAALRVYLLTFAIALGVTIVISALLPAAGPIAFVDRATFEILRFTGATPLDHLMRLRAAGPLTLTDAPGGIATFPSFHATVAVLTPLCLRGYPRIFVGLLVLNAAMLAGTITEGAHYFSDILAGTGMAFFAYALATRIIRAEDGLSTSFAAAGLALE